MGKKSNFVEDKQRKNKKDKKRSQKERFGKWNQKTIRLKEELQNKKIK